MNLTEEQKKLFKENEEKGIAFKAFLDEIDLEYEDYFKKQSKRTTVRYFFDLLESGIPPAIRLRYLELSELDEGIKIEVVNKYKELFGEYSDYQIIEN